MHYSLLLILIIYLVTKHQSNGFVFLPQLENRLNRMNRHVFIPDWNNNIQEDTNPKQVQAEENLIDGNLDSDILSEEKPVPALRSRRRNYILDYLSSFFDYPEHSEKFK